MRLAVGQRQGVQPLGLAGREYLRDRAAGVVRDQVDLGEVERVAAVGDEAGQSRQREVLAGGGGRVPVQRQVERHAAALPADLVDHVPPQVAAGAEAVHEQGRAAGPAGVDAAGRARSDAHLAAMLIEVLYRGGHGFSPRGRRPGYSFPKTD